MQVGSKVCGFDFSRLVLVSNLIRKDENTIVTKHQIGV